MRLATSFKRWLVACVFASCSLSAIAQTFEYVNLFDGNHVISLRVHPATVISGGRAVNATYCNRGHEFICVKSESLSFAVPIRGAVMGREWQYEGNTYALLRKEHLALFGTRLKVLHIESVQNDQRIQYTYSPRLGLIAFGSVVDGRPGAFVLQGRIGFGHK